jgi:16S rRNA processing protein RimM
VSTVEGWIPVGRLIRTRGNRGELIAEIYSSQPGRAARLTKVELDIQGRRRAAEVERAWMHDGRQVLKFAGIDTISDAEPWAGADILVPEAQRAAPGEGEYSHADLLGCRVIAQGSGQLVGSVEGVEEFGGAPLLRVEAEGKEILIPFARSICVDIDVPAKIIRVDMPEGLEEL